MLTDEFIPISEKAIAAILHDRFGCTDDGQVDPRRRLPRWPFPGTVELWIQDANGEAEHELGRALNLSLGGVGIMIDRELTPGQSFEIAIHQPEATLYGRATVRHCTVTDSGHHAGLEFQY
jgi:hypothetical protein